MALPTPLAVAKSFSQILGSPCQAIEGQAVAFNPRSRALLIPFLNSLGGAQSLVISDQALAVLLVGAARLDERESLQSALSDSSFDVKALPELQRIFAPLGALFEPQTDGLISGEVLADPNVQRSPDVEAVLQAPASRLDLQVTVEGYGAGRLSILSA